MLLISSLLMIVANNVPIFASFRWLWGPVFLLIALVFETKVFGYKMSRNSLVFGMLYCGILQYTLWFNANDWYKNMLIENFYAMLVIIILHLYLRRNNYIDLWVKLAKIGLLFIIITGVMTIVATTINPMVVRASYSTGEDTLVGFEAMQRLGFGSYGYMTALITLFPCLVYFYKKKEKLWLSKRSIIVLILLFFFVLLRSQIFANILSASLILLFSFLGSKRFKKTFILILLSGFILIIIPHSIWVNLLLEFSNFFNPESDISFKLIDMASFIQNPELDGSTSAGSRAGRYPELIEVFLARPIFGDASYKSTYASEMENGGHLYWMSYLALWGLLGFMGYLTILRNIFRSVLGLFDNEFKFYYYLSLLSVFIMGLIKNLTGREIWLFLLIIIPGLYLINLTPKKKE